jgi:hypothetical protein
MAHRKNQPAAEPADTLVPDAPEQPQPPTAYGSLPPTPLMGQVGLSFGGLVEFARKAINLLQTTGDTFIDLLETGFKLWSAISSRDLGGILRAFSDGQRSVEAIIKAIRDEFGIE